MPEELPKTHEIRLPDGRVGKLSAADYERLRMLADYEGLTVEEWFARHLEDLQPRDRSA